MMFDIRPYQLELAKLCKRYGVQELALFGSALRDDFDVIHSDLDFVVDFAFQESESYAITYFEFVEKLEALLGHAVDLISHNALRNPHLKKNIDATKVVVYDISKTSSAHPKG